MQDRREGKITSDEFIESHYERRGSPYEAILCDSPMLDRQFAQLRYKVFCEEHPEYQQEHNIDQTETDEFDDRSVKLLLVFRPLQMIVGGTRIILPDHSLEHFGLPCIQHPDSFFHTHTPFDVNHSAEISRFMISRLRLKVAKEYLDNVVPKEIQTQFPNPILSLFRGLYQLAKTNNIDDYCAMLEPSLVRIVNASGVNVDVFGDPVDCHGKRQTVVINLIRLLDHMVQTNIKNANLFIDLESTIISSSVSQILRGAKNKMPMFPENITDFDLTERL